MVESPQEAQHFRNVDVRVVVHVAKPTLRQVFEKRVEFRRHFAAQRLAIVRAAAVGVDQPIGRQSTSQFGVVGVGEEVGVVADERHPRVQQNRQATFVEFRRRFYGEENVL